MKRSFTLITLCVLTVVSYGLYNLKYEVEDLQEHANGLRAQMDDDRRAIKVLEAEWAYLSRPDRLQRLASKFLVLQPTVALQVGGVADLRLRPMDGLDAPAPVIDAREPGAAAPSSRTAILSPILPAASQAKTQGTATVVPVSAAPADRAALEDVQ